MSASMTRLGQHFLKDRSVLRAIAEAVYPRPGETIIEIGAGHGELTPMLGGRLQVTGGGQKMAHVIALEKDVRLADALKEKFAGDNNIEIIAGDALLLLPKLPATYNLQPATYAIVGNIPYYITGRLLRILGELEQKPSRIVLTIQKEVAERITAKPSRMNRLAAIVQFWAEPRVLRIVPRSAFRPEPDVDSAVIILSVRESTPGNVGFSAYTETVRKLFAQPRKTVLNNLRATAPAEDVLRALRTAGIAPNLRPQDLGVEIIATIASRLTGT